MKKTFLWNGVTVMLLLMAAACSSDDADELMMEEPEQERLTMTIVATQGDDADTRLAYNPSADGKQIDMAWTEGDALIVTDEDYSAFVELTLASGAGTNKGTFTTTETLPDTWVSGETQLMAVYKANDYMLQVISGYGTYFSPQIYDNPDFSQTANNSMEHLATTNYMQFDMFTYAAGELVNLKFSQMGAIMKLSLSGLGGKTVNWLKLVAEADVFLFSSVFVISSSFPKPLYQSIYEATQTLSFGDAGITLGADETLTAYMMLGATELTDGKAITLLVEATDGYYSATLNGGKLEAGKIYSLSKAMTEHSFFGGGTGTEADPFLLSTAQHLRDLNDWINLEFETEGKYFQLQNDIDLSTECGEDKGNWIPRIGTKGNVFDSNENPIGFNGTFDGNGKTVRGLYYNDSETDNVGFFGCVAKGGTLKDLHVVGDITAYSYSGGVVARNFGNVSGCTFSGAISIVSYGCGGIVGTTAGGTVVGCTNYGAVSSTSTSSDSSAGGIVGYVNGEYANIVGCYNAGEVSNAAYKGSIVGDVNYANVVSVIGCYDATTSLEIVGRINESTVTQTANYTSTTTDWAAAMTEMNTAISSYGWQYVANTDEATEPLKLEKVATAE